MCQRLAVFEAPHQGARQHDRDVEIGDSGGVGLVGDIEVEKVAVMARRGRGIDRQAELGHHFGGRSLDRLTGDNRRDGNNRRAAGAQRVAHAGHGEDRVDADERVRWAERSARKSGSARAARKSGCGAGGSAPAKASSETDGLAAQPHEIILEVEPTLSVRSRVRTLWSDIGSSRARDAEAAAEIVDDGRQALAGVEAAGALDMRREIAVAEAEPGLAAERFERGHKGPGLAAPPPAEFRVGLPDNV